MNCQTLQQQIDEVSQVGILATRKPHWQLETIKVTVLDLLTVTQNLLAAFSEHMNDLSRFHFGGNYWCLGSQHTF